MKVIDLNCDMGEGSGNDAAIMPFISSVNIACGFHAGDASVMHETVDLAIKYGVAIGAHPSFYDKEDFGRKEIALSPQEIYDIVLYQVSALAGFVKVRGHKLSHVKPHGALYNMAARVPSYAEAIVAAVKDYDPELYLYGLSGSYLIKVAKDAGIASCSEVFADRTYQHDGSLTPRSMPGAVISDLEKSKDQVLMMAGEGKLRTLEGKIIDIVADTVCIHGDHEGSDVFAREISNCLRTAGFSVKAFQPA